MQTIAIYKYQVSYRRGDTVHRTNGPARICADGKKEWWVNGELHREDGPAIEHPDGSTVWCLNGNLHREDGPAVEYSDGSKMWCLNGNLHRIDGPAIVRRDGDNEWYLNDTKYTEEEFNAKMNPVVELTVADVEKLLGKKVKIVK